MKTTTALSLHRVSIVAVCWAAGLVLGSMAQRMHRAGVGDGGLVVTGYALGLVLFAVGCVGFVRWFCSGGAVRGGGR